MEKNYRVGSIVEGKVVRITNLGAFVELEPGIVGFVRTAQCALRPIAKVEDALEVGQKVCTKVTKIFGERIKLSIREALIEEITAEANTPIWSDERRAIKWLFHREALIEELVEEANTPIYSDERRAIKWLFH